MKNAKLLLQLATESFPPDHNRKHSLTLGENGNLKLTLSVRSKFVHLELEPDDLERDPHDLIVDVTDILLRNGAMPKNAPPIM